MSPRQQPLGQPVRNYLSTILTKIGATTRAEAIVMAHRAGLGSAADSSPTATRLTQSVAATIQRVTRHVL